MRPAGVRSRTPATRLWADSEGPLEPIIEALERQREARWARQGQAAELKLDWRARFAQKFLHILPGERILEFGAGSGILTERLNGVLRGQNPITAVAFCSDLLARARAKGICGAQLLSGAEFLAEPPVEAFDFAVGSGVLWQPRMAEALGVILRALKPGGQILFFEPNLSFPARLLNEMRGRARLAAFDATADKAAEICARSGFSDVALMPHDIVSCRLGYRAMKRIQAKAVLIEHMPGLRLACGTMCLSARKQGARPRPRPNLAEHRMLHGAVSVVVPAHNEEANIRPLVEGLLAYYGDYIHEIVIVNDNSTDGTAEATLEVARDERRVKLVNRTWPNGVGLALRDGYRAATGRYILSMDCDFVEILPEFRALFDAVAEGAEGAIGSRFSHDSVLLNYPFAKMLSNRVCHLLIKAFLMDKVRDVSNNLKLYRADILQNLEIESPHFSANLETGLKPLLAGYDITEVAISWINRTPQMGSSTFNLPKVGLNYARMLYRCWKRRSVAHGTLHLMVRGALARLGYSGGNTAR